MAATSELVAQVPWSETEALITDRPPLVRQLLHDRTALAGLVIVAVVTVMALAAPLLAPQDPNIQDVVHRLQSPSLQHPLGTDNLGRDELSRIIYGSRVSVLTTLAVGIGILALGLAVGIVSGLAGGSWTASSCGSSTCCWRSRAFSSRWRSPARSAPACCTSRSR